VQVQFAHPCAALHADLGTLDADTAESFEVPERVEVARRPADAVRPIFQSQLRRPWARYTSCHDWKSVVSVSRIRPSKSNTRARVDIGFLQAKRVPTRSTSRTKGASNRRRRCSGRGPSTGVRVFTVRVLPPRPHGQAQKKGRHFRVGLGRSLPADDRAKDTPPTAASIRVPMNQVSAMW